MKSSQIERVQLTQDYIYSERNSRAETRKAQRNIQKENGIFMLSLREQLIYDLKLGQIWEERRRGKFILSGVAGFSSFGAKTLQKAFKIRVFGVAQWMLNNVGMIGAKRVYAVNDPTAETPLKFNHQILPEPEGSKTLS